MNKKLTLILIILFIALSFGFFGVINSKEVCESCSWIIDYKLFSCTGDFEKYAEGLNFNCISNDGHDCCPYGNPYYGYSSGGISNVYVSSCDPGETSYTGLGNPDPYCYDDPSSNEDPSENPEDGSGCTYAKSVNSWSECENGTSVATSINWETLPGNCPSNIDTTRSCCAYISSVDNWGVCENGISTALDWQEDTLYNQSCPESLPLEQRCAPTASNMELEDNYCVPISFLFSWSYDGFREQLAYQIQLASDVYFNNIVKDSEKINSSSQNYRLSEELPYNTNYYWRVKVWDSEEMESEWSDTEQFSTPGHKYPLVDFGYVPESNIRKETEVQFFEEINIFDGLANTNPFWTFEDATPQKSNQSDPIVFFQSNGDKQIILQATDSDGFSCSWQKTVTVGSGIIKWLEINPWSFLFNN